MRLLTHHLLAAMTLVLAACGGRAVIDEPVVEGVVLLHQGDAPFYDIVVAGEHVYWTRYGYERGAVMRCPKAGCPDGPTSIAPSASDDTTRDPRSLAADDTRLYWVDLNTGPEVTSRTVSACRHPDCDDVEVVATSPAADVAVLDGELFMAIGYPDAGIARCPASGCEGSPVTTLGQWLPPPFRVVAAEGFVAFSVLGSNASGPAAPLVGGCPASGCGDAPAIYLDRGLGGDVALDDSHAYFVAMDANGTRGVWRCPKLGCDGDGPDLLYESDTVVSALVVDDDRVYLAAYVGPDADSGTNVVSCPKSGCVEAAMLHGSDPQSVVRMTQDDEHLFWIGGRNDARIMRAPK